MRKNIGLSFRWVNAFNVTSKCPMLLEIFRPMYDIFTGGGITQKIPVAPILSWPNRSLRQIAPTVRTNIGKMLFEAIATKRAFETTNHCLR